VYADAHARPEELDPLAFARYDLSAILFMTLSSPHVIAIGTWQSALDDGRYGPRGKSDFAL
jgi:hypothetical protein